MMPVEQPLAENLGSWLDRVFGLFNFVEAGLTIVLLLLALALPRLGDRGWSALEARLARFAASPVRACLLIGALAVLLRAAMLPWLGAPTPTIHDEQSLLLQAQTYMLGRLANPVPPFWPHFETFHLNLIPAYASMYFPGRGAPLFLGMLVAGHPWFGVWLAMVLMCMAAVWMLRGWVSPGLALVGGLLVVLRLGVFSYWINSYWGGAFTALGGFLVIGALPRLLRAPSWRHGAAMGMGALILMTTRPYEGALLCVPVGLAILVRFVRSAPQRGRLALAVLPVLLLVGAGGALTLAHNKALTGDATTTAYDVNRARFALAPAFLVSPPIASQMAGPAYFRDFYIWESVNYARRETALGIARTAFGKIYYNWNFFVGVSSTLAFVFGLWAARREPILIGTLLFFSAGYMIETWNFPHYAAPIYPLLLILVMRGVQALRNYRPRGRPTGLALARTAPTVQALLLLLPASAVVTGWPVFGSNAHSQPCCAIAGGTVRGALIARLRALPGRDLVFVRDRPDNPIHTEMVYNDADIARADIVWARRLSPARDAALQRHYAGRRVWEFEWRPGAQPDHRFEEVATPPR